MPYETQCAACDGAGCEKCHDGIVRLTGCPRREIGADIWELLEYAELFRRGLAPEPGGALDQAAAFLRACGFIWGEQQRIEAEIMNDLSAGRQGRHPAGR